MMNARKLRRSNLKKTLLYAAIPFIMAAGMSLSSYIKEKRHGTEIKTPERKALLFLVDTIFVNKENYKENLTIAQYAKASQTVTSFWAKLDSTDMTREEIQFAKNRVNTLNSDLNKMSDLLHENRHKHNHEVYEKLKLKYARPDTAFLKPEHDAELYMHDEVSANIEQLLYARDLYLEGRPLDSISIPSKAYKAFLNTQPKLTKKISSEELAILAQKGKEWDSGFKNSYSASHGTEIASTIKADIDKQAPSDELSNKIFHEILSHYYNFYYHGKYYSVPFERLSLSDNVKNAILEAKEETPDASVLGNLQGIREKKASYTKKGDGKLHLSELFPNYDPNTRSL